MSMDIKLQVFEGPLDLLLHLIDKNKINIYDIPIVEITDQYMAYLHEMEEADLDVMSEFLLMAATLLDIKCKMLLPKEETTEEEAEDPRDDLVKQLLEYKMYKSISYELKDREMDAALCMYRSEDLPDEVAKYKPPIDLDTMLEGVTLSGLNHIFNDILARNKQRIDPIRSHFGKIEKEEIKLEDRILWLSEYASEHECFSFRSLLETQKDKISIIVTFLAVLELIKSGRLTVTQENIGEDINIFCKQGE